MTYDIKRGISVEYSVLTVPVSAEVQTALEQWYSRQPIDGLIEALAPFGLHPWDLAAPRYERVVTADDVRGQV